jgi:hypothetical protein
MPSWIFLLYPQLSRFDAAVREKALARARDAAFDGVEIAGICIGLGMTALLTRYSVEDLALAQRMGAALANFIVALPLLACLVGPFLVRRTRRGLGRQLNERTKDAP